MKNLYMIQTYIRYIETRYLNIRYIETPSFTTLVTKLFKYISTFTGISSIIISNSVALRLIIVKKIFSLKKNSRSLKLCMVCTHIQQQNREVEEDEEKKNFTFS